MGRLQTSVGLVTGTNIIGTVDALIALSGASRDRLVSRNEQIQSAQQQLATLTANVIGVQLSGKTLSNVNLFRSKKAESSNTESVSVAAGDSAVAAKHSVRALQTAATHLVQSAQRFSGTDTALGLAGSIEIQPSGFVDQTVKLADLNDGRGVQAGKIRFTDRSGATATIDTASARTVDDVITLINDSGIGVRASTVGGKIKLTDRTGSTTANLKVEQLGTAETAADLGLFGIDVAADSVTGNSIPLPSGKLALRGVALSQLGGGAGLGTLTTLEIALSDGTTGSVDVSAATSLSEVVESINQSGLRITARINDAGNGLQVRDVSGGTSTFSVASADDTAANLGINRSTSNAIITGNDLNLQTVTAETTLASLNQGNGITTGSFTVRDSSGAIGAINLAADEITTVGGLVSAINDLGIGVTASINAAGDGISVTDTAAGNGSLVITDTGSGTAAARLGIAGTATSSLLTGGQSSKVTIEAIDTLDDIVKKINDSDKYADASIVTNDDGTYSLQVRSKKGGESGRIAVNANGFGSSLDLRTTAQARDAVLAISTNGGTDRFLTSTDGVFKDDATGLTLTVKAVSTQPVAVDVTDNPDAVISAVETFVNQYNKLQEKIKEVTFFNADTNEVGLLFGSTETLRIQSGYERLLASTISGVGSVRSFAQIGIRLDETGTLKLDKTKLRDALTTNAADVEKFFVNTNESTGATQGIIGKLSDLADRFAGDENSTLLNRSRTLGLTLERNEERVTAMNRRLASERERVLKQYQATELAISKIQNNQSAIASIQRITI